MPVVSSPILYWPLLLLAAYLVGSIPFAQLIAGAKGEDLRRVGSGNVGAGNLTRSIGLGWGAAAAVLDGLKGLLPVLLARKAGLGTGAAGMAGVAAVVGNNWSIIVKGRSGRGLAAAAGLMLALSPALAIWVGGWSLAGWRIGGGLAGFVGWGLLPVVSVAMGRPVTVSLVVLLLSAILVGRRMQGNPGDETDTSSMLRRAVYDRDPATDGMRETADDPLSP